MACQTDFRARQDESYQDVGNGYFVQLSLATAATHTVLVPDTSKGFKIYPVTNIVTYAVGASVSAKAAFASITTAAANLQTGHVAMNDVWDYRLLPAGSSRKMYLYTATTGTTCYIEFF